jgi:acyl-CoA-binding protein
MSLIENFEAAQERVKKLTKTPETSELLELYGLYKQSVAGDVTGSRPGMLDFKGRAKYDAWAARRGTSKEECMQSYVNLVSELEKKYGTR